MQEAEAAYQVGIAHFEGIGFPKDSEKGLQWLERAALGGSKKALSRSPNIFASMDRSMSSELGAACDSALPDLAKHELHMSSSSVFHGNIVPAETFSALRRWINASPQDFHDYLLSSTYGHIRDVGLSLCLIDHGVPKTKDDFDFSMLEGYSPFADVKFDVSKKPTFIKSVRQQKCLQRTDMTYMTLLQRASGRGDMELVKTLVLDLGASIDACGVVPGLTPLWISCFNGHVDIALFLVQQGAMPTCRDSIHGRTILHFLNQFQTIDDIARISIIGAKAGLSLEEKDDRGYTPLMSTFIGWDFSDGIAAKFLLDVGANVLVRSKDNWSPMCAAVKSLNVETSRAIAEKYRASSLRSAVRLETPAPPVTSTEDDKRMAFCGLITPGQLITRQLGGADSLKKLQVIVELLLDERVVKAFERSERSEVTRGTNPLIGVSYVGRDDLTMAVLNSTHCPAIDEVDELNGMSALHWSVERGRIASAMQLLSLGANPLLQDKEGLNVFHRAARFSPSLLLQIFESMDSADLPRPAGYDSRSIIAITNSESHTPFMIAVIEGSTEHLKVAEILRKKYQIEHDSYSIRKRGTETAMTLMAYLVHFSVKNNLLTLEQTEYILNLNPQPRFQGDTSGDTLLHYAVRGWSNRETSLGLVE